MALGKVRTESRRLVSPTLQELIFYQSGTQDFRAEIPIKRLYEGQAINPWTMEPYEHATGIQLKGELVTIATVEDWVRLTVTGFDGSAQPMLRMGFRRGAFDDLITGWASVPPDDTP